MSGQHDAGSTDGDAPADHDVAADVGAFIRSQREVARMSVRKLAELAGVSNPYLSQIERGMRRPSADILRQLAEALRINVEALYVRAGLLHDDADRPGVIDAIERDHHLTPDQKSALTNVYLSFVALADESG